MRREIGAMSFCRAFKYRLTLSNDKFRSLHQQQNISCSYSKLRVASSVGGDIKR